MEKHACQAAEQVVVIAPAGHPVEDLREVLRSEGYEVVTVEEPDELKDVSASRSTGKILRPAGSQLMQEMFRGAVEAVPDARFVLIGKPGQYRIEDIVDLVADHQLVFMETNQGRRHMALRRFVHGQAYQWAGEAVGGGGRIQPPAASRDEIGRGGCTQPADAVRQASVRPR
jgi:hypothetical protein